MLKNILLIINPQNDFCNKNGSLYIEHSEQDIENICSLIQTKHQLFDKICVVLDTHLMHDIASPYPWVDNNGNHPKPYTILDKNGIDKSTGVEYHNYSNYIDYREYLIEHYKNNRTPLIIWPHHCIIGTWGHNIVDKLQKVLYINDKLPVWYKLTGHEVYRDNYNTVEDFKTLFNDDEPSVNLYICGESKSHSVYQSVKHIITMNVCRNNRIIYVLQDCTSSIKGFQKTTDENYIKLADHSLIKLIKSTDVK